MSQGGVIDELTPEEIDDFHQRELKRVSFVGLIERYEDDIEDSKARIKQNQDRISVMSEALAKLKSIK